MWFHPSCCSTFSSTHRSEYWLVCFLCTRPAEFEQFCLNQHITLLTFSLIRKSSSQSLWLWNRLFFLIPQGWGTGTTCCRCCLTAEEHTPSVSQVTHAPANAAVRSLNYPALLSAFTKENFINNCPEGEQSINNTPFILSYTQQHRGRRGHTTQLSVLWLNWLLHRLLLHNIIHKHNSYTPAHCCGQSCPSLLTKINKTSHLLFFWLLSRRQWCQKTSINPVSQ